MPASADRQPIVSVAGAASGPPPGPGQRPARRRPLPAPYAPRSPRPISLTVVQPSAILRAPCDGGVAEWLKAAVLKTAKLTLRGFESHRLLHHLRTGASW